MVTTKPPFLRRHDALDQLMLNKLTLRMTRGTLRHGRARNWKDGATAAAKLGSSQRQWMRRAGETLWWARLSLCGVKTDFATLRRNGGLSKRQPPHRVLLPQRTVRSASQATSNRDDAITSGIKRLSDIPVAPRILQEVVLHKGNCRKSTTLHRVLAEERRSEGIFGSGRNVLLAYSASGARPCASCHDGKSRG